MGLEVPPPEALPALAAGTPHPGAIASIGLILVSVLFAVSGQLTLKSAMTNIPAIGARQVKTPGATIKRVAKQPRLWVGLFLFGVSAIFWLVVLTRLPLSVAYPFVGVTYIIVVVWSRFVLDEAVPPLRWLGVVMVALGIAVVGLSFRGIAGP
jgi:multidrug transporter EmrE-like cation transporter